MKFVAPFLVLLLAGTAWWWITRAPDGADDTRSTPVAGIHAPDVAADRVRPASPVLEVAVAPVEDLVPAAPPAPGTPAAGAAAWRGRILDATGQPLAGARVLRLLAPRTLYFTSHGPVERNPTLLDDAAWVESRTDGSFELAWAQPGPDDDWVLLVRHPAHVPHLLPLPGDLQQAGPCPDLPLQAGGTVVGRVLSADGSPAAGVEIELRPQGRHDALQDGERRRIVGLDEGLRRARSETNGRFVLGGFPALEAKLVLMGSGHLELEWPGLVVLSGQVLDVGDLQLARGGTLAGRILGHDGHPLAGAEVRVSAQRLEALRLADHGIHVELEWVREGRYGSLPSPSERAGVATSDADGRFELGGLSGERYAVLADAPGHEPLAVGDIATGTRDLELRLAPLAPLRLRVLGEPDGQPLGDESLTLYRVADGDESVGSWSTSLPLERLAAGEYRAPAACPAPLVAVIESPARGTAVLRLRGPEPGEADALRELHVPEPAIVTGRLLTPSGSPVPDAKLSLELSDAAELAGYVRSLTITPAADGSFRSGPVPAGHWVLWASAEGHSTAHLDLGPLGSGQAHDAGDVLLVRLARVEVEARDALGRPLGGVMVLLHPAGTPIAKGIPVATGRTAPDGRLQVGVPPGAVRLEARDMPLALDLGELAEGEVRQVLLQPRAPGRLEGVVRDAGGPLADVQVELRPSAKAGLRTTTDAAGRWALDVPGGHLGQVVVRPPDGGLAVHDLVTPEGATLTLDLVLPEGTLRGRLVTAHDERGVEGLEVQATHEDSGGFGRSVRSAADGSFEIRHLGPGRWKLYASGRGYEMVDDVHASVPGDLDGELQVAVERLGSLRGTVRGSDGELPGRACEVHLLGPRAEYRLSRGFVQDGAFSVKNVLPGSYELAVMRTPNVHGEWTPEQVEAWACLRQPVHVEPGEDVLVDLVLPPGTP